jgi:hypothetical protein
MVIGSRTQGAPCFFRVRRGRENASSRGSKYHSNRESKVEVPRQEGVKPVL